MQVALDASRALSASVRLRACKLLALAMRQLDDASEALLEAMQEAMLARLGDKSVGVRVQAVRTLQRLQSPDEESAHPFLTLKESEHRCNNRRAQLGSLLF